MTDTWAGTKLQIQINLKLSDFLGEEMKLYRKANQIQKMLNSVDIGSWMIAELSRICDKLDGDRISRYSFLFSFDFEIKRSVILPIGAKHDPTEAIAAPYLPSASTQQTLLVYFLVGGILAIALLAGIIIVVHYRLRADYALLAKDKVLSGGSMAKNIWNRLKKKQGQKRGGGGGGGGGGREAAREQAGGGGLMGTSIHDDDDDLNEFM
jgi:hypothetical protein